MAPAQRSATLALPPRKGMLPPLMSEDHPSTPAHRSWFERISQALSGEPRNIEELLEELRQAQANGLLSNDTLSMVEGAIEVADLTVADVMVPRGQVVSLAASAPFQDTLAIVIEVPKSSLLASTAADAKFGVWATISR